MVTLMDTMVNIILLHWIQLLLAILLSNALVRAFIQAGAMAIVVIMTLVQIIAPHQVVAMEQA